MSSADLFAIGASGLKSFRAQMGAVSENIANSDTPNYNRRTVNIKESALSVSTEPLYIPRADFGGSEIDGVSRANDPYLDATARLTGSSLGSANTRMRWLSDVETALNDDALGVGNSLSNMYGAIDKLAASPGDPSLRTNMVYSIEQVVTAFHSSSDALNTTLQGTYSAAQGDVTLINDSLSELARVNDALLRSRPNTSNYAQLLDSRDAELSKITQRLDVTITFGANEAATLTYDGQTLVQGNATLPVQVSQNANGTLQLMVDGTNVTTPTNGSLHGLFTGATVARQRLDALDTLAVQFSGDMNTWHTAGLTDANAAGGALLSVGTTAASLAQVLSDPSLIAAKSADGRLNGNLLNIGTTRGTGSVEQGWTALVVAHGNLVNTTKTEQAAAQTRDDNAQAARADVSGVDLDREAADLIRIQQAYQAAARIIQAARDITDAILNLR
ncbi:MAG: flagellar hook-associated protein FlgK [Sphingobium sp.]|nr:flagellar hook-associated protein FlgK [Sphingobium sp.]MCP5400726.1 flagellar hook-associated protein FlgK [Sphingomonas sp.]